MPNFDGTGPCGSGRRNGCYGGRGNGRQRVRSAGEANQGRTRMQARNGRCGQNGVGSDARCIERLQRRIANMQARLAELIAGKNQPRASED